MTPGWASYAAPLQSALQASTWQAAGQVPHTVQLCTLSALERLILILTASAKQADRPRGRGTYARVCAPWQCLSSSRPRQWYRGTSNVDAHDLASTATPPNFWAQVSRCAWLLHIWPSCERGTGATTGGTWEQVECSTTGRGSSRHKLGSSKPACTCRALSPIVHGVH